MLTRLAHLCLSLPFIMVSAAATAHEKASTVNWPVGQHTISVTFIPPFPDDKYSVAVMPMVMGMPGGFSPGAFCTYFGIAAKTPTTIRIQHKRCDTGAPVPVDQAFRLDWQATKHTQ